LLYLHSPLLHDPLLGLPVFLRINQRTQFDQVGHRVEFQGVGLAAQAQRLQAGSATTHEGVQQAGWPVGEGLFDQLLGLTDSLGVAMFDLVPIHDSGDELLQLFAFLVRVGGWD
jgi:hypothetical protein